MDIDLIVKVKMGERQAFHELYDEYSPYALRTAYAIIRNKEDAADAVQETFMKVYQNISSFDLKKPFKAWFYRILVNECNNIFKKKKAVIPIEDYLGSGQQLLQNDIYTYEEHELLFESLQQLDEIYRIPIILKYLNDFSEKEISKILEISLGAVKSRLFKAREKLRLIIEKFEECAK